MKLSSRDAGAYFRNPDPKAAGCLIYGEDAVRVTQLRTGVLGALLGPEAEAEMRLARMQAADLRSDAAALLDAVKAVGFFPGPRAVLVEQATDGLAPVFAAALADWKPGDAQIVVTAGILPKRSALRKVFEESKTAYAAGVYDDPPGRAEIEELLRAAGVEEVDRTAMTDLETLARTLSAGDFRQTIEKLGLYKRGDATPVAPADLEAVAPLSREAELDDILHATAEAASETIGPVLSRLKAQGVAPVTLCIAALRHFRALHAAACHPGGAEAGLSAQRPPVFGPRRDRLKRQLSRWRRAQLETAISMLVETDLALRSSTEAPQMAMMERTLIRLAMLSAQGRR
ncbi:DNA polymerase III subunit delta [Roseibacterium sp. SDUM158016]|uniref:DNA polymerase III subunit delta n=1 Tax=Roseicyclus sediminis TaxID=2980997 RepID=UPI0021D07358|nr:DNA polymerase III subunit delta [Roseibacterium sp. SDUM158016]MCU4652441.1 DNA polymerase III subunit delta [Roseibacterium sp. SDUM158016]